MAYFPLSYSKESPIPIRSIYIPYGQSTAKVYISAIDDAIHESSESVDIQLKERTNSADFKIYRPQDGNKPDKQEVEYKSYRVDKQSDTGSIDIIDKATSDFNSSINNSGA